MTLELRPLGVSCNIACTYCYQNPQRAAGNVPNSYDWEAMKATIERENSDFSLFGGEALLVPKADLEKIWSYGLERSGSNGLQTNGVLIDEDHIRLFRKYKVAVGISLDGPGELNDVRRAGDLANTRASTARAEAAIERLCREGMPPSLIVTLHRGNASRRRLPLLRDWIVRLERLGVRSVRLHILESDHPSVREKHALTEQENVRAFLCFAALERRLTTLRLDVFEDMRRMLLGKDRETTCVWNACDPYTTRAVRGVEGDGRLSNCGRTLKDGVDFLKANKPGYERYLALHRTPQEHGGCGGCRFFLMCKGQCPGTAVDGDWRNRTEHCGVWKKLYGVLERELQSEGEAPLSRHPRRESLERAFLDAWAAGRNPLLQDLVEAEDAPPAGGPSPTAPTVRLMWTSDQARDTWKPRLVKIAAALQAARWDSVADGDRPCATGWLSAAETASLSPVLARRGLKIVPLAARVDGRFEERRGLLLHVAVGSPGDVRRFARAWKAHEREEYRRLLGAPECCRRALEKAPGAMSPSVDVSGPPLLNPLWRPLGIEVLPYLPCSFDCAPSAADAERLAASAVRAGRGLEMEWARDLLSWPAQWSALHGISELKTPIVKICAPAEQTAAIRVVRYLGAGYPAEGARGLGFPYR